MQYHNGAIEFNGVDEYVQINKDNVSDTNGFLHGNYQAMSISLWFKPYALDRDQMIYNQGGRVGGFSVRLNKSNLQCTVSTGNPNVFDNYDLSGRVNEWIHVAISFDNGIAGLYIDGKLIQTITTSGNQIVAAARSATIGGNPTNANGF